MDGRGAQASAHERGLYPAPLNDGRSRNMRANRRRDSKPELLLRSALHREGYRFRADLRLDLQAGRVRPDIVFTRRKVAIFVDGCFWHGCPLHGRQPKVNDWYWGPKLARNRERDEASNRALLDAGWSVTRVWEHVDVQTAVSIIRPLLEGGPARVPTVTHVGNRQGTETD